MNNHRFFSVFVGLAVLCMLGGCRGGGSTWHGTAGYLDEIERAKTQQDREAILKMAGTFKVSFSFEETLPLQDGYTLDKPYQTEAEELVIVVENTDYYISLQHLLVVRHGEETHVINHWRQDWVYHPKRTFSYVRDNVYYFPEDDWLQQYGRWTQHVYNVADSPRYSARGTWNHHQGVSTWQSSPYVRRPLPLREASKREDYNLLQGTHRLMVSDRGWLHMQDNIKHNDIKGKATTSIAMEHGLNQYLRVPDEGFEKAHEYWQNTEAYWRLVREVWAEVLADADRIQIQKRWKGDPLFSHLFGLADEYWGQSDVSEARPRIEEIIDAFVVEK